MPETLVMSQSGRLLTDRLLVSLDIVEDHTVHDTLRLDFDECAARSAGAARPCTC
jgi:hypothetical protein